MREWEVEFYECTLKRRAAQGSFLRADGAAAAGSARGGP